MSRRGQHRNIASLPGATNFKPQGIPASKLEVVELQVDEYEAIRLADGEGLYHAEAAHRMGISRQTFGRILESARQKVADTLTHGKLLRIHGGNVKIQSQQRMRCRTCEHDWQLEQVSASELLCPKCDSSTVGSVKATPPK